MTAGIRIVSNEDMLRIHRTAVRLITEIGLEAHFSDSSFEKLRRRGVRVDVSARRLWPSEAQVLETIRQLTGAASTEVTANGVDAEPLECRLPTRLQKGIGAHHGFVFDLDRREQRPSCHADFATFIKLNSALTGHPSSHAGIISQEVPGPVQFVHAAAAAVKYAEMPGAPDCNGPEDGAWIARIMQAAGAWSEGQKHLGSVYSESPLVMRGRGAQLLEWSAAQGIPRRVTAMPLPGATAPATPVGLIVVYLAECFGFSTLSRLLVEPPEKGVFSPQSFGDDVCIVDLRRGAYILAGPEISVIRLALKQMVGEFYKVPGCVCCGIRAFRDAKEPGAQASVEAALQLMADLAAGVYVRSGTAEVAAPATCLGSLNANLTLSAEQAVLDCEMVEWAERFLRGLDASDEALGFDTIAQVGPGGAFLDTDHAFRHVRSDWWYPTTWHRGAWDAWVADGMPTSIETAREIVREIERRDLPCRLGAQTAQEVDRLVEEAEMDLLGYVTGVLP